MRPRPAQLRWLVIIPLACLGQTAPPPHAPTSPVRVPVVWCETNLQLGPLPAATGESKVVRLSEDAASRLAYYRADHGFGVLAPRGWNCFGTYGPSGEGLYLSEQPTDQERLFSWTQEDLSASIIEIRRDYGDTSGRFAAARAIARVFPAYRGFVDSVVHEGIEPAASFPSGPYPHDKLRYKGKRIVEYETPARMEGLGTQSRLQPGDEPIRGVAILLGQTPDLLLLSIRVNISQAILAQGIIQEVEREAAADHQ